MLLTKVSIPAAETSSNYTRLLQTLFIVSKEKCLPLEDTLPILYLQVPRKGKEVSPCSPNKILLFKSVLHIPEAEQINKLTKTCALFSTARIHFPPSGNSALHLSYEVDLHIKLVMLIILRPRKELNLHLLTSTAVLSVLRNQLKQKETLAMNS